MKNGLAVVLWILLSWAGNAMAETQLVTSQENTLRAQVILSDNPQFINNWFNTPAKDAPFLQGTKLAQSGEKLTAAFLVSGLKLDDKGSYDASISFVLLKPDGRFMFGQQDYATLKGKAPPGSKDFVNGFIMADPALDIVMDTEDPKGIYTLQATVLDRVAMNKVTANYSYTLQ